MAAATFADTNDFPTFGVAETTPSILQPRSRWSATSLERIRLKLRELALRLSKPWTSRRRASVPLHANGRACARLGKIGAAILTCVTSLPKLALSSNELCCIASLTPQEAWEHTGRWLRFD